MLTNLKKIINKMQKNKKIFTKVLTYTKMNIQT
jgi:hypothetical protein